MNLQTNITTTGANENLLLNSDFKNNVLSFFDWTSDQYDWYVNGNEPTYSIPINWYAFGARNSGIQMDAISCIFTSANIVILNGNINNTLISNNAYFSGSIDFIKSLIISNPGTFSVILFPVGG